MNRCRTSLSRGNLTTIGTLSRLLRPLCYTQVGGNAVVPLGELGGWVNSTVCLRGVVVNRFPTTGTQLQNGIQFTKVSLLDDSTASEVRPPPPPSTSTHPPTQPRPYFWRSSPQKVMTVNWR